MSEDRHPLLEGLEGTSDDFVGSSTAARLAETSENPEEAECIIDVLRDKGVLLGNDRDDDRLRLIKYIANHPEGVPISKIWRDVFARDGPVDPADADYQFARRFYKGNSEYFDISEQNGMTAVEFTLSLLDLISQGIAQKSSSGPSTNRQVARSLLSSVSSLNSDGIEILSSEITRYVNRINDWRLLFRAINMDSGASELFMKPYKTRFNDIGRINQQWARYHAVLDHAREEYSNAVSVTLTTDPSKFANLEAMAAEITENFNRLMSWMAYECKEKETSRPGFRPPYLRVLEWSEKGYPHLHILFFDVPTKNGKPYLIDKDELSQKWDSLGQGRIVDIQALEYRDDLDEKYNPDEGFVNLEEADRLDRDEPPAMCDGGGSGIGGGQTAGQYLGKYLSLIFGGMTDIGSTVNDNYHVHEQSGSGADVVAGSNDDEQKSQKAAAYKVGMYWATGKRIWTCSKEIEEAIEPEEEEERDLPIVIEYLGAYPFWDLPASVVSNARRFSEYISAVYADAVDEPKSESDADRPPPNQPNPMAET